MAIDKPTTPSLGGTSVSLYPTEFFDGDDLCHVYEPSSKLVMTVDFVQPRTVPFRTPLVFRRCIVERLQWMDDTLDIESLVSGHALVSTSGTRQDLREQCQYYLTSATPSRKPKATPMPRGASSRRNTRPGAASTRWSPTIFRAISIGLRPATGQVGLRSVAYTVRCENARQSSPDWR